MKKYLLLAPILISLFFSPVWPQSLPALKELPQWEATSPEFLSYKGNFKAFYLKRSYYRKDGARLEISLAGGSEGARLLRALKGRLEISTPSYMLKYSQEDGFQILSSFTPPDKQGFIAVFLKEEPAVVLLAHFSSLNLKEALKILKCFDWKGLLSQSLNFLEEKSS